MLLLPLVAGLIALSHVLFGAIICLSLFIVHRLCEIHSPPRIFFPFLLFMMVFPDVDHLYWMEIKFNHLFTLTVWDLFIWKLRVQRNPLTFLHFWIYPFIILGLLAMPSSSRVRWIAFGIFLGWTVHLTLDGVIFFI